MKVSYIQVVYFSIKCGWSCMKSAFGALKNAKIGDNIEIYYKMEIAE